MFKDKNNYSLIFKLLIDVPKVSFNRQKIPKNSNSQENLIKMSFLWNLKQFLFDKIKGVDRNMILLKLVVYND